MHTKEFNPRLPLSNVVKMILACVAGVLWLISTFQSKSDAADVKQTFNIQVSDIRSQLAVMEDHERERYQRLYDKLEATSKDVHTLAGKADRHER